MNASTMLDLVRVLDCLIIQVDELRGRLDAIDRRREGGVDPEVVAEIVASRLAPELDATRRAIRTGRRTVK